MLRKRTRPLPKKRDCEFCKKNENPDYKKPESLGPYATDRGKILGRSRSGLCAKHQRRLAKAIKRARFLALLPFTHKVN